MRTLNLSCKFMTLALASSMFMMTSCDKEEDGATDNGGKTELENGATIPSNITADLKLSKGNIYKLSGGTHVKEGATLFIEEGVTIVYGLYNAQERGELFVGPGVPVYAGMVIGENPKGGDIVVNVCKTKHLSNCRASGSDDALRLTPPRVMSLEDCIEFLGDDEYLEVTPKSIRIRKIILDHNLRLRERGKMLRGEI